MCSMRWSFRTRRIVGIGLIGGTLCDDGARHGMPTPDGDRGSLPRPCGSSMPERGLHFAVGCVAQAAFVSQGERLRTPSILLDRSTGTLARAVKRSIGLHYSSALQAERKSSSFGFKIRTADSGLKGRTIRRTSPSCRFAEQVEKPFPVGIERGQEQQDTQRRQPDSSQRASVSTSVTKCRSMSWLHTSLRPL